MLDFLLLYGLIEKEKEKKSKHPDQKKIGEKDTSSRSLSIEDHKANTLTEKEYRERIVKREKNKEETIPIDPKKVKRRIAPALKLGVAIQDHDDNCFFCKLPIYKQEEYYKCFTCGCISHKNHLHDWLEKMDYCPLCKETLMLSRPINEKEKG